MSTMQTAQPLTRLPLNTGNEPVYQVANLPLDLNAPYQRGSVWGKARQRNLIRSLLLGIPVGNVYINNRGFDEALGHFHLVVVDGKQRIEAIRAWLNGDLDVPASWFRPDMVLTSTDTGDGPYVRVTDLTDLGSRMVLRGAITTQRTDFETIAEEEDLFNLVNYGGLAQGDSDFV